MLGPERIEARAKVTKSRLRFAYPQPAGVDIMAAVAS